MSCFLGKPNQKIIDFTKNVIFKDYTKMYYKNNEEEQLKSSIINKTGELTREDLENTLPPGYTIFEHIQKIEVGPVITSFANNCFFELKGMNDIYIPNTISAFSDGCFNDCWGLTTITFIPSSVTKLGKDCFSWCWYSELLEIPKTVTEIGQNCFEQFGIFEGSCIGIVLFKGRTLDEVKAMTNYPWGIENESQISAEL